MPVVDPNEAKDLDEAIERLLRAASDNDRAARLRSIFVEKLDFSSAAGVVDLRAARCPINQATRVAEAEGVHVVWAALPSARILLSDTRAISKALQDVLGDHLLVASNAEGAVWHFAYPTEATTKPILRRMVVERGLPRRTVVTQLAKVYHEAQKADVRHALESAYNVEPVTKDFFTTYRRVFAEVMGMVQGVPNEERRRLFCQTLFNRLMFLYFLQRKGWLKFNGDSNYLPALLRASMAAGNENFFCDRLKTLFFAGLNNPQSVDVSRGAGAAIGEVPFLNGGLFEEGEVDHRCAGAQVPDDVFDAILTGLFERFNFTVSENTPYDIEVAVDPEMLGKVFEELVTGRHETGSYYTPRPVVAFMCREALKGYLETRAADLSTDAIRRFVDEHNVERLDVTQAGKVAEALDEVTVCDPACGSGAYLVGMLHELIELKQALYSEKLGRDPTRLYDMKLHVIERNLYGADIDQFAINIAMLRLWLSLIIDFEGATPPPLPNLDFKIVCGDSLTAPNPQHAPDLFRNAVHEAAGRLGKLKGQYLHESGPDKARIKEQIGQAELELGQALAESPAPSEAVDWRVEFAEVFDRGGGFHIALANPPYVRADAQFKHLMPDEVVRERAISRWTDYRATLLHSKVYTTLYEKWDLYIPFLERSHQLLGDRGRMVFIISDAYNTAKYASRSHDLFIEHAQVNRVDFCSDIPLFEAGVKNTIVHFTKAPPSRDAVVTRIRRRGEKPDDFESNPEILSAASQEVMGPAVFRIDWARDVDTVASVRLGRVCYISYGVAASSDEKRHRGEFVTADIVSHVRDAIHPKPYVEGKDIVRWYVPHERYLEWGTERAPSKFRRQTFPELHEAPEKLLAARISADKVAVAYDDKQRYSNHTAVTFVQWHHLIGVRNTSIRKTAKYRDENQRRGSKESREELEKTSRRFLMKYVLAVMNSTLARDWIAARRRGKLDIYPDDWKDLPVPEAPTEAQAAIIAVVDQILQLYRECGHPLPPEASAQLAALDTQIDEMVCALHSR